jgi:2-phosphosulfolactate phosphatase
VIERIDVAVTPAAAPVGLRDVAIVIIDVLRATTTIVRALESGAAAIVPCLEPDEAIAVRNRIGRDRVLLAGERDAQRVPGFDLDNSPASFTPDIVTGKTIAFTTTNGTRALQRLGHAGASAVFCAALSNRRATVDALAQTEAREALLVCAGTEGAFSLEDFLCAGAIAHAYADVHGQAMLSDAARAAALTYHACAGELSSAVASGEHAQHLAALGFRADILAAAQLDTSTIVAVYREGEIVSLSSLTS